jgi:hypothetical protein
MAITATNSELEQLGGNSSEGSVAPGLHGGAAEAVGAAKILVASDSGKSFLLDTAAGSIVSLPAVPIAGMKFKFIVTTAVTSNNHIIKTNDAAIFIGGGIQQFIIANAVSEGQVADAASHVTMTMNGTTTGGLLGTVVEFEAISATVWIVNGLVGSSGTLATPFA